MSEAHSDHLIIKVWGGKNLVAKGDAYVSCSLTNIQSQREKKKKSGLQSSLNPVWDWECATEFLNRPMFKIKDYLKINFKVKNQINRPGKKNKLIGEACLTISEILIRQKSGSVENKITLKVIAPPPPPLKLKSPRRPIKKLQEARKAKKAGQIDEEIRELVIEFTLPPLSTVEESLDKNLLELTSASGREILKVATSKGIQTFYELPPFAHNTTTFSINNALWFAKLAQLAYKNEDVIVKTATSLLKMEKCKFFDDGKTDAQGYGMYNDKATFIVFRGTESSTDGKMNVKFVPRSPFEEFPNFLLHYGFWQAFASLLGQVEAFLKEAYVAHPENQFYICGHSLGGAMAQCCMFYYLFGPQNARRTVHKVYTIGQPIVSNDFTKKYMDCKFPDLQYYRFTNHLDVVPGLGVGAHIGTHVHISADGKIDFRREPITFRSKVKKLGIVAKTGVKSSLADHSSATYFQFIEKHWMKYEVCKMSSLVSEYNLLNSISYLLDKLHEELKLVRKYKNFFRDLLVDLTQVKLIVNGISDHLTEISNDVIKVADRYLSNLSNNLFEIYSFVTEHTKTTATREFYSFEQLEKNRASLNENCAQLRSLVDILEATNPKSADGEDSYPLSLPPTDADLTNKLKQFYRLFTANNYAEAIAFYKENVHTSSDPSFIDNLIILAQCAIEIGDFPQAFTYLQEILNKQNSFIDVTVFNGEAFAKAKENPVYKSNFVNIMIGICDKNSSLSYYKSVLTDFERERITEYFDEADANGDLMLSFEELGNFGEQCSLSDLVEILGWEVVDIEEKFKTYQTKVFRAGVISLDEFLTVLATLKNY